MGVELVSSEAFRRLADAVLEASTADHAIVSLTDAVGGTTRFANNQVVQNVNTRRRTMAVTVAFGRQRGTSRTTDLAPDALREATRRAEAIARLAPDDPEYLPPLPPQTYAERPTFRPETAAAGPARRLDDVRRAIAPCRAAGLEGAGIVAAYASVEGLAASTGLFAYEPRTRAEFSLTATGKDSSGWVKSAHRSIDELGVDERTKVAVEKARLSAAPKEIPPGRYTVILEPAAVAGLLGPMSWALDAKAYDRGTSALSGRLGKRVIDERLTLANVPGEPRLLGRGFGHAGIPGQETTWIEDGVLRELSYDRFTAKEHGVAPSAPLDAPRLSGAGETAGGVEDLVRSTERGILVTNFWYIRSVNPTDLTLTGMTRDGTFLVEDGKVRHGLVNFRWHDSPLRAFDAVLAYTAPQDAISMERRKMLLPAMKIADFHFSSVTRF